MIRLYSSLLGFIALLCLDLKGQDTTYALTGSAQIYTVPPCVYSIMVDLAGGKGSTLAPVVSPAGKGGRVEATIPVTPGEVLTVFVGGAATETAAGYNGGGTTGTGTAGWGGGASDIRRGSSYANVLVVAGGGGGAGSTFQVTNSGGDGGGLVANDGLWAGSYSSGYCGKGGSQTAGGEGVNTANDGLKGQGGAGGAHGGGGGGGYWGGGAGAGAIVCCTGGGGGGGSSYAIAGATSVQHTIGFQDGDGYVTIRPVINLGPGTPQPVAGPAVACEGDTVTYSVPPVYAAGNYAWTLPQGTVLLSGDNSNAITIIAGKTSGNVSLSVSNPCGMGSTVTKPVTFNPKPDILVSPPDPAVCMGQSITLTATGAAQYTWAPMLGTPGGVNDVVSATPSGSITYQVTGTSAAGCSMSQSLTIEVKPIPGAPLPSSNSPVCEYNTVDLWVDALPDMSYDWTGPAGFTSAVANPSFPVLAAHQGVYTVRAVADGCYSAPAATSVSIKPSPFIQKIPDAGVCQGNLVTLRADPGFVTYQWSTGETTDTLVVGATGTYTLVVTNEENCRAFDTVEVSIFPLPKADFGTDTVLCTGDTMEISPGAGFANYIWSNLSKKSSLTIFKGGTYTVHLTDEHGCKNFGSVRIMEYEQPAITLGPDIPLCEGETAVLSPGEGYASYLWSTGSILPFVSVKGADLSPGVHEYWVQVSGGGDCITTDTLLITASTCDGITATELLKPTVFPNPSKGFFLLRTSEQVEKLEVRDALGRVVQHEQQHISGGYYLSLPGATPGLYFLHIQSGKTDAVVRTAVE